MKTLSTVCISFPSLKLQPSDGHKLRGYFATWYREKSDLLHNHKKEGESIYRYPLVQYKVLRRIPTIVGIGEGARLLIELFLELNQLIIGDQTFPLNAKNIQSRQALVEVGAERYSYIFLSPWLALNQQKYNEWRVADEEERARILHANLERNIQSFLKAAGVFAESRIITALRVKPEPVKFKGETMTAFRGEFTVNALLPDLIGLGKSVSRGFGVIQKIS